MTREEIKQGLRKLIDGRWRDGNEFDIILHAIKELEKTDWIPVTERLPEEEKEYLVTIQSIDRKGEPSRIVTTNWWIPEANNWAFLRLGWETITAWAEKPEPYAEGADAPVTAQN